MIVSPLNLLMTTAAIPILAGVGVLLAVLMGHRRWGLTVARLGFAGGALCAAMLAILLAREAESTSPVLRMSLWTWFSLSGPQSPSLTFGLEATSIKACLISLIGGFSLIALWNADSDTKNRLSDHAILTTSLLYAAGTIFVFAPNLAQALLGWGTISLLAGILIRLSRQQPHSMRMDDQTWSPRTGSMPAEEVNEGSLIQYLQFLGSGTAVLERVFVNRVWKAITYQFPNWIAEQAEVVENSSTSFQLLATVLGVSAILLTWLNGH